MTELTVCLITANRPRYLKQTLESLLKQSYGNFKLIVGDNSSDTKSEKIIKELYPNAKYYRNKENIGEIRNSNKCLSLSTTPYTCLLHDDDLLEPEYLSSIMKIMKKKKTIELAYTGRIIINEKGEEFTQQLVKDCEDSVIFRSKEILDYMLLGNKNMYYRVFINTPGLIFKTKIFKEIGGFDTSVDTHCDTDFLLKSLAVSHHVLYVNSPLFMNRIWHGVSGRTKSSERGEVFFAEKGVIDNFLQFCKKKNIKYYLLKKKKIYEKFSYDALSLNGPFGWIALRFTGPYLKKVRAIFTTAKALIQLNNKVLFFPQFYIVFLSSIFLPTSIVRLIHGPLLSYYLKKS